MVNILSTDAKWLQDMKRSPNQKLRYEFSTNINHIFYGPDYTVDSKAGFVTFLELRETKSLEETINIMKENR